MRFRMRHLGKLLFVVLALAALGGAVMLLWNAVMPGVFIGARTIDYLQALGLLVLSRILLGGFRGHGGWHARQHWAGRWQAMSPEEREQFRRHMPRHWQGGWHERWHAMHDRANDGPNDRPHDGPHDSPPGAAPGAPREGAPR